MNPEIFLQSFGSFSQGQMIFLSLIVISMLYASVTLRSAISGITTTLTVIILVAVMQFNLEFIYFWYMVILSFISIAISISIYTIFQDRV